jgi:alcohol dehydrogenase class IV
MGVDTTGMTTMQASDRWFDEVERLLKDLNIKPGHLTEQFGFEEKDVDHIVQRATSGFNREGNPRDLEVDDCTELLKSIL